MYWKFTKKHSACICMYLSVSICICLYTTESTCITRLNTVQINSFIASTLASRVVQSCPPSWCRTVCCPIPAPLSYRTGPGDAPPATVVEQGFNQRALTLHDRPNIRPCVRANTNLEDQVDPPIPARINGSAESGACSTVVRRRRNEEDVVLPQIQYKYVQIYTYTDLYIHICTYT